MHSTNGSFLGRFESNPAEIPGVVVCEPDFDPGLVFNPETKGVVDPASGNKFWRKPGHGSNPGRFGIVTQNNEPIVEGSYYTYGATLADGKRAMIFDIARTYLDPPGNTGSIYVPFDIAPLSKFFRVQGDEGKPIVSRHFLVVDSRPVRGVQTT